MYCGDHDYSDYTTAGITGVVKTPDGSTAIKAEEKGFDGAKRRGNLGKAAAFSPMAFL